MTDRPDEWVEYTFANIMTQSPLQQRPLLRDSFLLKRAARKHALDMATNGYFSHVGLDGRTANKRARDGGFSLPSYYAAKGNNIESLAAGQFTAEDVWRTFLASPGHRAHILGENDFFRDQDWFGVGHAYNELSMYKNYWVVLIARAGECTSGE